MHLEAFLKHYHHRSNIESVFSMIKRKLGHSVRSRIDTAMKNEVFAKIVCHNICCLIRSQFELGIEAAFWPKEELEAAPEVAPAPMVETEPTPESIAFEPVAPLMEFVPAPGTPVEAECGFADMLCWV